MNDSPMPTAHKILLAVVLAIGIFARSYHLGDKILWGDEGFVHHAATRDSLAELKSIYRLEQHTALPNTIDYYWVHAFGDSMAALHAESLLWSVLALMLFSATMYRIFPRPAAFGAVAAMSLNAMLPEYAQMFRYPALAGFFAAIWLCALLMLHRTGRGAWLPVYAAGLVLSMFAHLFSLFAVFSLGIFVLFTRKAWGRWHVPLVLVHALPALAIAPKLLLMRESGVSGLAVPVALGDAAHHLAHIPVGGLVDVFYQFTAGNTVDMRAWPLPALAAVLLLFGAVCAAGLSHSERRFEAAMAACVAAGTVLLAWAAMIFRSVHFQAKYFVPLVPLFCVLLGLGADRIRRSRPRAAPVLLIGYAAFSLGFLIPYWTRLDRPPNFRSVTAMVENRARPDDLLAVSPPYPYYIRYYWDSPIPATRFRGDHVLWHAPQNMLTLLNSDKNQLTEKDMLRWHRDVAAHGKRVWMFWILGTMNTEDRQRVAFKWMERHYQRLDATPVRNFPYRNEFTGILVLYRIRPLPPEAVP